MSKKIKFSQLYVSIICIVHGVHQWFEPPKPSLSTPTIEFPVLMRQLEHFEIARAQHAHTVPCKVYRYNYRSRDTAGSSATAAVECRTKAFVRFDGACKYID